MPLPAPTPTQTLVDWALEVLAPSPPRVLDLGTGSGAIALAPAKRTARCPCAGGGRQPDAALTVAQANAQRLGLPCSSAAALDGGRQGAFDAIVSNPPYIPAADPHLAVLAA